MELHKSKEQIIMSDKDPLLYYFLKYQNVEQFKVI